MIRIIKMMSLNSQIDSIMDTFDFAKCQKVMEFLDWKWALDPVATVRASIYSNDTEVFYAVPTESQIRKSARQLMNHAVNEYKKDKGSATFISSGGLAVSIIRDRLMLSFEIEYQFGDY